MYSISELLHESNNGKNFDILFGDFLDIFYRIDKSFQIMIINDCPSDIDIEKHPVNAALLASAVHKLANDHNLPVPSWVYKRCFYLSKPFFGGNASGNLRWWFMYKSPPEFKHRNLFVCENILKRV